MWVKLLEENSHIATIQLCYYCISSPLLVISSQLLSIISLFKHPSHLEGLETFPLKLS